MIIFKVVMALVAMHSRPASNSILALTSIFTPSACHHHFTCGIERKEHFWKVLMNILNIIYFPRLSFSKCNFPSVGNFKDLVYPISTIFVFAETRAEHRYFVLNLFLYVDF